LLHTHTHTHCEYPLDASQKLANTNVNTNASIKIYSQSDLEKNILKDYPSNIKLSKIIWPRTEPGKGKVYRLFLCFFLFAILPFLRRKNYFKVAKSLVRSSFLSNEDFFPKHLREIL
jgi:hypothetical protein